MPKYRKKQVIIEAVQFFKDKQPWPDGVYEPPCECSTDSNHFYIETDSGHAHIKDKDWVCYGVDRKVYICKPDVFKATYEKVEQ